MLKLYKEVAGKLNYWETWDKDDQTAVVHWGVVGEKGESKEIKSGLFSNFRKKVQEEIDNKIKEGFSDVNNIHKLVIEYQVDGHGTKEDLEKRHMLEGKMDELLGWRGLGHCDGGSIGNGTMEVLCFVVSFDIAKNIIESELKNTEFSNYTKIFEENN